MAAWNVIEGFTYVSARTIFLLAYTTFESIRRLFLFVQNSGDDEFELFRKASAVQDTLIVYIGQRRGRVLKIGTLTARTLFFKVEP